MADLNHKKPVRVWVDGCFDMLHFGHANALRQAKKLGDKLVVGIHSDEEITHNKGVPVFNENERYMMLHAIKWVDEIVFDAPYVTELETLRENNCDFCAHGDDITVSADGQDTYHKVKAANKFKEFKRTQGVSTTNMVQRLLSIHSKSKVNGESKDISNYTKGSVFYPNTLLLSHFQDTFIDPSDKDVIIYVPGSFDLFHIGHCMLLEKCSKMGTYLIVGLYSDEDVAKVKGSDYPIMPFYERLLSVLSCKFVSNVILAPSMKVTQEMMDALKIDKVVHGKVDFDGLDEYFKEPLRLGKFEVVDSGCDLSFVHIVDRITAKHAIYEKRNHQKELKELEFVKEGLN